MKKGPVRGKNAVKAYPFAKPIRPLMTCECVQPFKMATEMPCSAVRVGV
ncbi:MAG: hypothetical protein PVJ69_08440 [Desulfobacteraceae bacterium]|jgi:hypothetical protein